MSDSSALPNRGPARKSRAPGERIEMIIEVQPALKRDLYRKAENRNQRLNQFLILLLSDAVSQIAEHTDYFRERPPYLRRKRKQKKTFLKLRIEPDLRSEIEKRARNRQMYTSELIRDILTEANRQLTDSRKI